MMLGQLACQLTPLLPQGEEAHSCDIDEVLGFPQRELEYIGATVKARPLQI
jgi:hypothetical protein